MSFTTKFRLESNQYFEGCPVLLLEGALLFDNSYIVEGKKPYLAQLKFKNMQEKPVKCIELSIRGFVGGSLVETFDSKIEMLAEKYRTFGDQTPHYFAGNKVDSFDAKIKCVYFADGTLWENQENKELEALGKPIKITDKIKDLEERTLFYNIIGNRLAQYVPEERKGLYICACGNILNSKEERCDACHKSFLDYEVALDEEALCEGVLKKKQEEQQRIEQEAEEARIAKEKRRAWVQKNKKFILCAIAAIVVAIVVIVGISIVKDVLHAGEIEEATAAREELAVAKKDVAELLLNTMWEGTKDAGNKHLVLSFIDGDVKNWEGETYGSQPEVIWKGAEAGVETWYLKSISKDEIQIKTRNGEIINIYGKKKIKLTDFEIDHIEFKGYKLMKK